MTVQIRNRDTGLIAQVGPDYFAAMTNMDSANIVKNVFSTEDERHDLTEGEFYAVTDSCGIPRDQVQPGNFWTRELDNQRALTRMESALATLSA